MSRTAISAVALVCAAVVAGAAAVGDATTAQVAAAPTRCDTGDLRASLLRSSRAAGQRYAHVQLTNISPRTCTIFGYAGAQPAARGRLPRADRHRARPFAHAAPRHAAPRPARVRELALERDRRARRDSTDTCETIKITPPDATKSLRIRWAYGPVCEHGQIVERPFSGPYY